MMRRYEKFSKMKSSSNIIPMINVAFCIIVILMVISPFLSESRIKIDVPEAVTSQEQEESKITVSIAFDGRCMIDDVEVNFQRLSEELAKSLSGGAGQVLLIKADKNVPYSWIRKIIEASKSNGISRIAIGTQKPERADLN